MGLNEKRALKEYQDNKFPEHKKEIEKAVGFKLPIEVKWDSLAKEGSSEHYEKGFSNVYFTSLTQALKAIASDNMGRKALKDGLKKVIIQNTGDFSSPNEFTFQNGSLVIDHAPDINMDDVKDRASAIQKLLEKAL